LNVTTGKDQSLTDLNNDRPDQVLQNVYANSSTPCPSKPFCVAWINPAAFVPNPTGTYGNVGRNALRGPGNFTMDVSLSRVFKIRESSKLETRADFFNILNRVNYTGAISPAGLVSGFTTLSTGLNAGTFGQVQSAFDPRIIQFAMKLYF
jgi:hypothetical protein